MNYPPDMYASALKMLTALVVVLAGLLAVYFFIRRVVRRDAGGASGEKLIRVLANNYIGVKKSISLVEVPGAILVLGVTSDRICFLDKIADEKIPDHFSKVGGESMQASFSDLVHKFSSRFKTDKKDRGVGL